MLEANELANGIFHNFEFRNGFYRAVSLYRVSLSFGEFGAMMAPIGAYFVFHGENRWERALGFLTVILAVFAIFCAGARGAFAAVLVAMPILSLCWMIRFSRLNPHSIVPAILSFIFFVGWIDAFGLIMFSHRLSNVVLGGDDSNLSNDGRMIQWQMGVPHILSNPITGHGTGMSGPVIGFRLPNGTITIDSYILSLLVEVGVPGLFFFLGMIVLGVMIALRLYLADADKRASVAGPLGCSIIAFSVYRMTLSQRENHTLFFLIVGLVFAASKLAHNRAVEKGCGISGTSRRHAASPLQQPARNGNLSRLTRPTHL
jgi:O-antigen ligase